VFELHLSRHLDWFGQDVSNHVISVHIFDNHLFLIDVILNEEVANVKMLDSSCDTGTFLEDRLGGGCLDQGWMGSLDVHEIEGSF
jgi:hypothetical protein